MLTVYYVGHPDLPDIPFGIEDTDIFDIIGADGKNWLFITHDKRIRKKPEERRRFREAKVRAIFITARGTLNTIELSKLILNNLDDIVDMSTSTTGPVAYRLNRDGLKEWTMPK